MTPAPVDSGSWKSAPSGFAGTALMFFLKSGCFRIERTDSCFDLSFKWVAAWATLQVCLHAGRNLLLCGPMARKLKVSPDRKADEISRKSEEKVSPILAGSTDCHFQPDKDRCFVRIEDLEDNERSFRNIFEDAAVGIYRTTPDGRLLMVNPYLAQLHGYENPEDFLRSITNIATQLYVDPERRADFLALMEKDGIVRNFEMQARTKDGSIRYLSLNAHAVRDENGNILWHDGVLLDITEKKGTQELVVRQRDLALKLAQIDTLEEGLTLILQTAIAMSGMESGGIFLKNTETKGLDLVSSVGLTQEFQDKVRHSSVGTFLWSYAMEKRNLHIRTNKDLTPMSFEDGYRIVSVMPMLAKDEVSGCLVVGSKVLAEIPERVLTALELLAAGSGNTLARMQTRQHLEAEIMVRREAEKALEVERLNLEEANRALIEANTALKVLLKHREEDKKELEEKVLANVQQLVMPHIEKLKRSSLDSLQQISVRFIESNLHEILSAFFRTMAAFNFTRRELEVATLVREGKTTKEIATLLNVGKDAVDLLRYQVRKKIGLNKTKTNLQSYLKSRK